MPTQSEVAEYESAINDLSTVAYAQLKALLQSLDTPSPVEFRDAVLRFYPELLAPFLTAASQVASAWYEALRVDAGIDTPFRPFPVSRPPVAQLDAGVRYSLTPLFAPSTFIGAEILTLLAGFTQRMISDQGRNTIISNTNRDPVRVGWQRVPQPGCCAFCAMLASRGATYRSRTSAGAVVGRGLDETATLNADGSRKAGGQAKGVRPRGESALGDRYHNYCRCVVVPVFPGADNTYLQSVQDEFLKLYEPGSKPGSNATDVQSTLALMRSEHGLR